MKLAVAVLFFMIASFSVTAQTESESDFKARAFSATAILYGQTGEGAMEMHCTSTAYAKIPGGYLFVTASHCVSSQTGQSGEVSRLTLTCPLGGSSSECTQQILSPTEEKISLNPETEYITFDDSKDKEFLRAEVVVAGLQRIGDDFAVLRVKTDKEIATIPLGDELKETMGSPVINFASPQGLGRQLMVGYISMPRLDRPVKEGAINWQDSVVLQIPAGPGSSGSSILSLKQRAIIGFLVGTVANNNVIAIPASKFKAFSTRVNAKDYKYFPVELLPKDMPKLPE